MKCTRVHLRTAICTKSPGVPSSSGNDVELQAACLQFEHRPAHSRSHSPCLNNHAVGQPYITTCCFCTAAPCGVACEAVPEQHKTSIASKSMNGGPSLPPGATRATAAPPRAPHGSAGPGSQGPLPASPSKACRFVPRNETRVNRKRAARARSDSESARPIPASGRTAPSASSQQGGGLPLPMPTHIQRL